MVVQRQPESSSVMTFFAEWGEASGEAVDEVDLGADGEAGAGCALLDGLDDLLGGAEDVGLLADLPAALWVDDDGHAGFVAADAVDVLGEEALMDRASGLSRG